MLDLHEGILTEFAERAVHADDYHGLSIVEPRKPLIAQLSEPEREERRRAYREYMRGYRQRNGPVKASEERKAKDREAKQAKRDAVVLNALKLQIRDIDRLAYLPAMRATEFFALTGLTEANINRAVMRQWLVVVLVGGEVPVVMGVRSSCERFDAVRGEVLRGMEVAIEGREAA